MYNNVVNVDLKMLITLHNFKYNTANSYSKCISSFLQDKPVKINFTYNHLQFTTYRNRQ